MSCPITVVDISLFARNPATCGAKPSSPNAATLSLIVTPASAPAMSAPYTEAGRCLLALRWATATVSNHLLATASSLLPFRLFHNRAFLSVAGSRCPEGLIFVSS
jgi:hypothetical protein